MIVSIEKHNEKNKIISKFIGIKSLINQYSQYIIFFKKIKSLIPYKKCPKSIDNFLYNTKRKKHY